MDSRSDRCDRMAQKRKALAQAIVKGNDSRVERELAGELWDMLKVEDGF